MSTRKFETLSGSYFIRASKSHLSNKFREWRRSFEQGLPGLFNKVRIYCGFYDSEEVFDATKASRFIVTIHGSCFAREE